jgi:hypothetical protein
MKRNSHKLILLGAIVATTLLSSCASKVIIESDHRHPHIQKRHPHERAEPKTGVIIKP